MADLIPCPISSVFLSVYLCGCGQFSLYFIPVLSRVFDSSLFISCLCFCVKIINKFSTIYQACCLIWFQMLNWTGNRMKDWPATSFPASNSWWWAVNQVDHSVHKWDQALAVRLSQRSSLQASAPGFQLQVCTSANKNPALGTHLSDQALAPGFKLTSWFSPTAPRLGFEPPSCFPFDQSPVCQIPAGSSVQDTSPPGSPLVALPTSAPGSQSTAQCEF